MVNDWSPWMKALLATGDGGDEPSPEQQAASTPAQPSQSAPPAHRIEDDRTAGTRGVTPQGGNAITGSVSSGQVTQPSSDVQSPPLAQRVQLPPNALAQRIVENKAREESLGNAKTPQSLGDTVLPGGGFWRGLGRLAINAGAGGVGQGRRDEEFKNTLAERTRLQNEQGQDTRTLSQEQTTEEGQNLRARIAAAAQVAASERLGQTLASRERNVDVQQDAATGRTKMQTESRENIANSKLDEDMAKFRSTDQYRRWKAGLDNSTRLHVAQLSQSKAPAALMQTAVFADGGIRSLNDAEREMANLERLGVMGQSWAQNKAEDWIFGKGAVDPNLPPEVRESIGKLRTSLNLAASAMTRAHTQRGSKEVYDDLKQRLGPGQDWSALRGAIQESQDMLGQYVTAASDANIGRIRSGGASSNTPFPSNSNETVIDLTRKK